MLLLEDVLVLGAQVHDRLHVHLVIGGQHGGRVLRVLEAAGDGLAQARHLHPLFAWRILGVGRPARRGLGSVGGRSRCGRETAADGGDHITLQHLSALAGAFDIAGLHVVLGHQLGGSRSRRHGAGRCGGRCRGSGCRSGRSGRGRCSALGRLCGRRGRRSAGTFGDLAEEGAEADGFAALATISVRVPAAGAGTSIVTLSVFELEQRFIGIDGLADLLEPGADSGFADGFAEGGYADFGGHDVSSVINRSGAGRGASSAPERIFQEGGELGEVLRHQARGRRSGCGTAGIAHALILGVDMGQHPLR